MAVHPAEERLILLYQRREEDLEVGQDRAVL
jgi:hypothetical protein